MQGYGGFGDRTMANEWKRTSSLTGRRDVSRGVEG